MLCFNAPVASQLSADQNLVAWWVIGPRAFLYLNLHDS